jgi:hypothetical protein
MEQPPPEGSFPRINGGMMQKDPRFTGNLVSLVGKVTQPNTLQTADGTLVHIDTDALADAPPMVNPDLCVEIMGLVANPTTITVSWTKHLLGRQHFVGNCRPRAVF